MPDTSQYLSISAVTQYIKRKFDVDPYLGKVYLVGEISNFRNRPNSHQYFSLKDDKSKISAIMFKNSFAKLNFEPEEGMKVLVEGRISLYEPGGTYQIYVDSMQPDGLGKYYLELEKLNKKLLEEGVFNLPKKEISQFPRRIAVVTSQSGAVIHDIMTTTHRRFPIVQIILYPAQVQGDNAADTIVSQLQHIKEDGNFDTIIIGRGGGSIEDLAPFNDERVARAILDSDIPVISSVGHETDTTIADLVADVRAATPTAAAEIATPELIELLSQINDLKSRLFNSETRLIKSKQQLLDRSSQSVFLKHPERIYEVYLQKLDSLIKRLSQNVSEKIRNNKERTNLLDVRLKNQTPLNDIEKNRQLILNSKQNMISSVNRLINLQKNKFAGDIASLDSLSPLKTLTRGYTISTDKDQNIITSVKQVEVGNELNLKFIDGNAKTEIISVEED
ncbi:exodeoxyribonuclease VII large subunit [Lactobacillus terrae]|uniref:exodeoxyribonuclease VII large subunit n=1 Tax=Lactobacillus terrae TaxID=2269374 RepID=UPI000C1B7046|nr:exodeoxyribonuclease VII large subunit [Lactobacillus terrae]